MGVTGLWNIVTPLSKVLPLSELRGKTVAIDLSCWIVDSQTVGPADGCPKKYLRNIFFRATALLLNGILPVFVLEGTAPVLKYNVLRQRNNARKDAKEKKSNSQTVAKKRGRGNAFNATLKECELMLEYMGLSCIKAHGEAEAMCAYLNADGLVDGCVTQDSDCFLYGAKTIYRNFTLNDKSGFGCAVEEYSLEKIQSAYNFGRNKMIALALLCGCDYDPGVPGIGKDSAMKWLQTVDDDDILDILKNWRYDEYLSHPTAQRLKGDKGKLISNEHQIRKKCMTVENFPNQDLIDEFVVKKGLVPSKISKWSKPDVISLIRFLNAKLKWQCDYTVEKVIPILTRWNVENLINIDLNQSIDLTSLIIPKRIIKIRNLQSIRSYEIEWNICTEQLNSRDLLDNEGKENYTIEQLSTIEPQELVQKAYPELVRTFEEAKNASKKKSTRKRNGQKNNEKLDNTINHYFNTKQSDVPEVTLGIYSPSSSKRKKDLKSKNISSQKSQDQIQKTKIKKSSKKPPKLDSTIKNIFETLDEQDFLTDVEDDTLEMSLVVARLCGSADYEQKHETVSSLVNISESNAVTSNCIQEAMAKSGNTDSDESSDDLTYIPLDVRIKK